MVEDNFFKEVLILQIRKYGSPPFPASRCVKHDYLLAEWSRLSSSSSLFTAKLCRLDAMDCDIRYIWRIAIKYAYFWLYRMLVFIHDCHITVLLI